MLNDHSNRTTLFSLRRYPKNLRYVFIQPFRCWASIKSRQKGNALKSGSGEVVLVPKKFVVLNDAADHVKQRFPLQLGG